MDNKITLRRTIPAIVILTLNRDMATDFIEFFNIEIEVLQGEQEQLSNGRVEITVEVNEQKADFIQDFLLKLFSQPDKINLS